MGAPPYLESQQDASCPAPGLSLGLERHFLPGSAYRARLGALGRGWMHSYEITLQQRSNGTIVINGPEGFDRSFEPDGKSGYIAAPGDHATLSAQPGGGFLLTEKDGLQYRFRSDGLFDYIQDPNSNRITAQYDSGGKLTEVAHSSGDRFTLAYDAVGRLASLTDQAGRVTTYAYDASGEQLLSVTTPDGEVTSYSYVTGEGPLRDYNVASISRPGGVLLSFSYDSLGRLAEQHIGMSEQSIHYSYSSAGKTLISDALGNTSTIWMDGEGRTARIEDPLGTATDWVYDADSNPVAIIGPMGLTSRFSYDNLGNLVGATDPLGHDTSSGYDETFSNVLWAHDARENATTYSYDSAGNPASITYADGSVESFVHDSSGNLTAWTNRRGHTTDYTYNDRGQLTQKAQTDGTTFTYAYDDVGRQISATGPQGTTTLQYDGTSDRLAKVTYPGGRYLEFSYDEAGRRAGMIDQDGFMVNYDYDSAGRLAGLTDGQSVSIVNYIYDGVGRLIREDKGNGNGTYTTYEYDAAGQILHLVNHTLDDSVNSRFDYTYDQLDRRISMTTLDGTWQYEYDPLGNRVAATRDGEPANFLVDPSGLGDIVGEYGGTGDLIADYVHGLGLVARVGSAGAAAYYDFDANGSTIGLTGAAKGYVSSYSYLPYGEALGPIQPMASWFGFVGRWGVTSTGDGQNYVRARQYNASIGRFLSVDPLRLPGCNPYTYVDNSPTVNVDPAGLEKVNVAGILGKAVTTASDTVEAAEFGIKFYRLHARLADVARNNFALLTVSNKLGNAGRIMKPAAAAFEFWEATTEWLNYWRTSQRWSAGEASAADLVHDAALAWGKTVFIKVPFAGELIDAWDSFTYRMFLNMFSTRLTSTSVRIATSLTPEDKFGPAGYDAPDTPVGSAVRYVPAGEAFDYRIEIWNKPDAPVPTQDAVVRDTLDPTVFDLSTFEFTDFGFLKWDVPLAGGQAIDTRVDLRPDMNLAVEVKGTFNPDTGEIDWWFHAVDPMTGEYPEDPMAGFLPPFNPETGYEMGWVEFRVKPRGDLPSGTQVANQAFVEFDFAGDIWDHPAPPEGPWINTIHRFLQREGLVRPPLRYRRPRFQNGQAMRPSNCPGLGYLQMDVKHIEPRLSRLPYTCYEYAAIDICSRYKLALILPTLDETGSLLALYHVTQSCPFPLRYVQTDNGLEFQQRFHEKCEELGLEHYYIHKNSPNENAVIERSFRTDEDEFFFWMKEPAEDHIQLNAWYQEHLRIYNEVRPHMGLDMLTPKEAVALYHK
ncbi:MAG: integrase core domain-containing protein [Dehalococcoidia bacterium]|nr:integrase core domain-containing protein [Dehalococcoidia bacterium]